MPGGEARLTPAPPLLHLWVLLSVWSLAGQWGAYRAQIEASVAAITGPSVLDAALVGQLVGLIGGLAAMLLALGIVIAPSLRRRRVERLHGLGPLTSRAGSIGAISDFLSARAPGLSVGWNVTRNRELAFVYPSGPLAARLAVFGGLIRHWRRAPDEARAVLLHEIAHVRHGDAFVVGAGEAAPLAVRAALLLAPGLALAGFLLVAAKGTTALVPLAGGFVLIALATAAVMLSVLAVPISLIWIAELYADRSVREAGEGDAMARFLDGRRAGSRPLFGMLSHPWTGLRLAALRWNASGFTALVVSVFLGGRALQLALLLVAAWANTRVLGSAFVPLANAVDFLTARWQPFALYALLFALWPLARGADRVPRLAAAAPIALLAVLGHVLLPASGGPVTLTMVAEPEPLMPGASVEIRFGGTAGNAEDWLTVVPAGAPDEEWGYWQYTGGLVSGFTRLVCSGPGRFEIRFFEEAAAPPDHRRATLPFEVAGPGSEGGCTISEPQGGG